MSEEKKEHTHLSDIVVLYEDEDIVVIDKPSGLMVHEDGKTEGATVVDWLLARAPKTRGVGETGYAQDGATLNRSGIVHRLDRDTSGILILVKNQEAFVHMKAQFHDHRVIKEYRAFVYGNMKETWGTINRPIGRSVKDFRLRSAEKGARGLLRSAHTDWELVAQSAQHAYLRLLPKTGRMHQLRVHLKAISRPIIQDTLYAPAGLRESDNLGFKRLALHAYQIRFEAPSGATITMTAPLPDDFVAAEIALAAHSALC